MTAEARGWGPGWPDCQEEATTTIDVAGVTLRVRREVAPIFTAFLTAFHRLVEPLIPGQCGGFNCRPVRGTEDDDEPVPSNHSWGLAVDVNSLEHPLAARRTFTLPQGVALRAILGRPEFAHIRWGGDYTDRADEMHFEYVGTPAQARLEGGGDPMATLDKDDIEAIANRVVEKLGMDATHRYTGESIRRAIDRLAASGSADALAERIVNGVMLRIESAVTELLASLRATT